MSPASPAIPVSVPGDPADDRPEVDPLDELGQVRCFLQPEQRGRVADEALEIGLVGGHRIDDGGEVAAHHFRQRLTAAMAARTVSTSAAQRGG